MAGLLPSDHAEFNTKDYWNRFFQQRNKSAFEWYGSFADVLPPLLPAIRKTDRLLVIGCGNSNFSSELYDLGYHHIVNVDFSELVIAEMQEKNASRPLMSWDVGDMTKMEAYAADSFHAVLDKGALDALLSADTAALKDQARSMFLEVDRVLTAQEQGKYICVTLAESFVLASILEYFSTSQWSLEVWPIFTSTRSPFMPLMLVITKRPGAITVHVSATGQATDRGLVMDVGHVKAHIAHLQQYLSMSYRIGALQPGRFEVIQLYAADSSDQAVPRFTIYVVDVSEQARQSCAVFLVPMGRESEYQFTSQQGLVDIAYTAQTKRLIAVSCNRPHTFPDSNGLQAELSPVMMSLKPVCMSEGESIPYLGVGADFTWELLEAGRSDVSGSYMVEEREHEASGGVVRRLIFLQNQQLVQTEVRLLRSKKSPSKSSGGKKKGNKPVKKISSDEDPLSFDYQFIDDHHRGMMAGLLLIPSLPLTASVNSSLHQAGSTPSKSALVVGLGGGALLMCMQRLLPQMNVTAVEIDDQVRLVAEKHFGFTPRRTTQVVIADGLQFIQQPAEPRAYDLIILDVDGKDLSIGLSAPPKAFVEDAVLQALYNQLTPQGILILNVVSRSQTALQAVIDGLKRAFQTSSTNENMFVLQPSKENVNLEIICCKSAPVTEMAGKNKVKPSVQWSRTLDGWLKVSGCSFDHACLLS